MNIHSYKINIKLYINISASLNPVTLITQLISPRIIIFINNLFLMSYKLNIPPNFKSFFNSKNSSILLINRNSFQ